MTFALVAAFSLAAPPTIGTFAGTGQPGRSGDGGPAVAAKLNEPFDVVVARDGTVYFGDTVNHRVCRIAKDGAIAAVAGSGVKGYSGDGGPAVQATMNEPYGLALDEAGATLYVVDRLNAVVRVVDLKAGTIRTLSSDGKPIRFKEPNGIALASDGRLLVADVKDQRLQGIDPKTGAMRTVAGTGKKEHTGDGGPATAAGILGCRAVAVAPDGAVFICEREGHSIRRIDPASNVITRYAGSGKAGYSGDGGPALDATFRGPKEMKFDAAGNLFVVDTENHAIRRIDGKTHAITTVAGGKPPAKEKANRGLPADCLARPHGVAVMPDGAILIGDSEHHRVAIVRP